MRVSIKPWLRGYVQEFGEYLQCPDVNEVIAQIIIQHREWRQGIATSVVGSAPPPPPTPSPPLSNADLLDGLL